jgi:hypothetical protein
VVCSFWEAVTGSLSVATTAVSSAKVAVKESGEVFENIGAIRFSTVLRSRG